MGIKNKFANLFKTKKLTDANCTEISIVHPKDGIPCNPEAKVELYKSYKDNINKSFTEFIKASIILNKSEGISQEEKEKIQNEALSKYVSKLSKFYDNEGFVEFIENGIVEQKEEIEMNPEELKKLFADAVAPITAKIEAMEKSNSELLVKVTELEKTKTEEPKNEEVLEKTKKEEVLEKSAEEIKQEKIDAINAKLEKSKQDFLSANPEYIELTKQLSELEKSAKNEDIEQNQKELDKLTKSTDEVVLEVQMKMLDALNKMTEKLNEKPEKIMEKSFPVQSRAIVSYSNIEPMEKSFDDPATAFAGFFTGSKN